MDYLSTDLNAVESIDKDGNVQYHTGYFIVQNWITQNEVYNLVEIFKYNNPQYYFLNDVIRITNIEGITVFSIGII